MKEFVDRINAEISQKAISLSESLVVKINDLKDELPQEDTSAQESPVTNSNYKMFMIAGALLFIVSLICLLTGGVETSMSSKTPNKDNVEQVENKTKAEDNVEQVESKSKVEEVVKTNEESSASRWWAWFGLILGIGVGAWGFSQKSNVVTNNQPAIDLNEIKNSFATSTYDLLESANNEWDDFLKNKRSELQNKINQLDIEVIEKETMKSPTYVYESLCLTNSELLNSFHNCDTLEEVMKAKTDFANSIRAVVVEIANVQIEKYNSILNKV